MHHTSADQRFMLDMGANIRIPYATLQIAESQLAFARLQRIGVVEASSLFRANITAYPFTRLKS